MKRKPAPKPATLDLSSIRAQLDATEWVSDPGVIHHRSRRVRLGTRVALGITSVDSFFAVDKQLASIGAELERGSRDAGDDLEGSSEWACYAVEYLVTNAAGEKLSLP